MEFRHAVNGIGILMSRSFHIKMLIASAPFMAAEHGCQTVVTAVLDVSCNIVQPHDSDNQQNFTVGITWLA